MATPFAIALAALAGAIDMKRKELEIREQFLAIAPDRAIAWYQADS